MSRTRNQRTCRRLKRLHPVFNLLLSQQKDLIDQRVYQILLVMIDDLEGLTSPEVGKQLSEQIFNLRSILGIPEKEGN